MTGVAKKRVISCLNRSSSNNNQEQWKWFIKFCFFFKLFKSMQGLNDELVCKNHLILGQHLYKNLEGHDFELYGGAKFRGKGNKVLPQLSTTKSWNDLLKQLIVLQSRRFKATTPTDNHNNHHKPQPRNPQRLLFPWVLFVEVHPHAWAPATVLSHPGGCASSQWDHTHHRPAHHKHAFKQSPSGWKGDAMVMSNTHTHIQYILSVLSVLVNSYKNYTCVIWSLSACVQFADKTIRDILKMDDKFNRFLSLVDVSIMWELSNYCCNNIKGSV